MKYLEELESGNIFIIDENKYVISSDFRARNKNIQRMCVSLSNGLIKWIDNSAMVEHADLYYRDGEGNILPLKNPEYHAPQINNIS
jgi:hypothetical protein